MTNRGVEHSRGGPTSPLRSPERWVCAAIAEERPPDEAVLSTSEFDALWEYASASGVQILLAATLRRFEAQLSVEGREEVVGCLRRAQAIEMLRHRELRRIAEIFDAANVAVLLLKGAGLAYTVYSDGYLRPAFDMDLFVGRETLARAEDALIASGYERRTEPDAEHASSQRHYARAEGGLMCHFVDLHWRMSNLRLFADVISFEDARNASITVPALGRSARTLGRVDALLLACIHRVAHHQDDPHLLWLWDIHLLMRGMTEQEADLLVTRAAARGMCSVVARSLGLTHDRFGSSLPSHVIARLEAAAAAEPAAHFIGGGLRQLDLLMSDLAVGSLRNNLLLLREHLFPPPAYIRAAYHRWPAALMPVAYLHRICRGIPKWLVRPRPSSSGVAEGPALPTAGDGVAHP